ncbi:hypothetical protein GCM10010149_41360 [Nonomuraea roseoviolacea subsp. roseoviolacea]|uniref:hypothetical protein n=1 Tax=Nonomuraea roseoviolacea TaxID=103837 RepID=UPI0031D89128
MEFWKTILGLARQKLIAVPVAVLAVALAFTGYLLMPERYVTSASMVLVTPSGGGSIDGTKPVAQTNPLLQFTDDLRTTASILILALNTSDVFASVGVTEDGPTDLTIDDGRSNPTLLGVGTTGPFIYVQVESDSPGTAAKVLSATQERLRQELEDRQNELKAHPITFVQAEDVVRLGPEADGSAKLQGAVGGLLLGLVAGFGAAYAVVRRRLFPRTPVPDPDPDPFPDAEAEDEDEPAAQAPEAGGNGSGPGPAKDLDETGPIDAVRLNGR